MQKNTMTFSTVVRWALIAGLAVLWGFQIHADRITSSTPYDALTAKVTQSLDPNVYPMREATAAGRYFGLDPSQFENITLYRNEDAMSASELLIAKFDSLETAKTLEDAIEKRVESQHSIYEGYAPEQAAQVENALIDVQGNYGIYYVGSDPEAMDALFRQALRQGGDGQ